MLKIRTEHDNARRRGDFSSARRHHCYPFWNKQQPLSFAENQSFDHDFPFGSMNNLDQNPLNCQSSSRISPARSASSIDQFTHHHGKGDSAYSSFSGGSNAPDYSSPCLPEEMHSHSLQYVDHKYVRAVFNPNVLNPAPIGMDHLYKSMETFNMQCHQDFNTQSATNQGYKEPPQPPARMDSFITIRNLENTKLCQGPEGQLQQRTRTVSSPDIVYCKPDSGSARKVSQANQILPVKDYVCCEGADQASSQKLEMKKFTNILSRSPPSFILQECLKNNTGSAASSSEKQQRRPLLAQAFEQTGSQSRNSTQATQNMVNGNIQHKGQYYFVTGVCKPSEPSRKDSLSGVNARESKGRSKEDHGHLKNKEVSFNFRNDLPNQSRHKRQSSYEIPGVHGLKVYNESQSMQAWNGDQGYSNESAHSSSQTSPPRISKVPRSHSSEVPEPNPKAQSREIGYEFRRHHSSSHHIFYCGPEESDPPKQKEPVTSKDGSSSRCVGFISNNGDRGKRQPLGDVANDKINKEMTPMLYHLTGESGGAFTYKTRNENEPGNWKSARQSSGPFSKHKEASVVEPAHPISRSFCLSEGAEDENQDQGDTLCSSGSSVDDSYNKYYKEKIKDAQTKVLRETSFKRKDLQLSWPHRIKQKPSVRPSVIHSRASSLSSASDIGNDNPVHAGQEAKGKKEEKKLQDSQPQPARIGARKRLKPEQKKLCYSEPERLNQLEDLHGQSGHRPAGNEEEPSQEDFNEQGTVASRRKVFEKRGRTLSVSSISKNELKQIQHNALVEYMERKSGQKPAGPQQVPSQNPQRLSTPGRLADWRVTSSTGSGTQKQKRPRPLSAGRVLDSSSSSIRYAHSPGFQSIESHNQPNRRQSATQAPGKSASMESLLDQQERIGWSARSKFSSSPVQIDKNTPDTSPLLDSTSYSHQQKNGGDIVKKPVDTSREEHQVRTVSERRGKSMEELGISAVSGPAVLSKSSEQLDQIRSGEMPRQPRKSLGWEQKNQSSRAKVPETTRKFESEVPPFKKDLIEPRSKEEPEPVKASSAFERHPNALKTLSFQGVPCKTPSPPQGSSHLGPPVSGSPHSGPSCKAPMADSVFFNDHPSPQSLDCMELPEIEPGLANTGPSSTELLRTRSEKGPDESEPRGRLKTTHPVQCLESGSVGDPHQDSLYWDSTQASSPASDSGVRTESSTSSPAKHAESAATEGCSEGAKPPLNSSTNAKDSATQLPVPPTGEMSSVVPSTAPAGEPVQDNSITNKAKPENEMEDKTGPHNPSLTKPPSKSAVEQRWEELATAIVAKDLSLAEVLVPESNRKTTLKLMEQLLSDDTLLTEEYYKRKEARRQSKESDENPETNSDSIPLDTPGTELLANTSEEQKTTQDAQGDPSDVTEKKKALIVNIKWKLQCLEEQKEEFGADLQRNSVLGVSVETAVRNSCRPNEYERYTLFIGDLEKVVNLLLCLSSRLARVENALSQVNQATDPEDKQSLNERHRLLCRQHEDAKDLKENLLRRERVVSEILLKHLSQQQLQDYKHFVKVKASLLIEQRDLDERVRVSEEQLESLQNSIPPK